MTGLEGMIKAIVGEQRMLEMMQTFDKLRTGLVEFQGAINTIHAKQEADKKEILAAIADLKTQLDRVTPPLN